VTPPSVQAAPPGPTVPHAFSVTVVVNAVELHEAAVVVVAATKALLAQ
jgi:hypothetical protein